MRLSFSAWIRFLRLPNGLTVPGDVLAGSFVQAEDPGSLLLKLIGVLAAYWFGMGLNDLLDLPRDRVSRPERPLPSGQLSMKAAWMVTGGLAISALLLIPSWGMVLLLMLILGYTLLKERVEWLGPVLMASCRVCALWVSAGSPSSPSVALATAALIWFAWIWLVTLLARKENEEGKPPVEAYTLLGVFAFLVPVWSIWVLPDAASGLMVSLGWLGGVAGLWKGLRAAGRILPPWIGQALRLLLPLQATAVAGTGQLELAVLLLWIWPLLTWISRRVAMS